MIQVHLISRVWQTTANFRSIIMLVLFSKKAMIQNYIQPFSNSFCNKKQRINEIEFE